MSETQAVHLHRFLTDFTISPGFLRFLVFIISMRICYFSIFSVYNLVVFYEKKKATVTAKTFEKKIFLVKLL